MSEHIWTPSTSLVADLKPKALLDVYAPTASAAFEGVKFRPYFDIDWMQRLPPGWAYKTKHHGEMIAFVHSKTRPADHYNHKIVDDYKAFAFVRGLTTDRRMLSFGCYILRDQWPILRLCLDQFLEEWNRG